MPRLHNYVLGHLHPDTQNFLNSLGVSKQEQGKGGLARTIMTCKDSACCFLYTSGNHYPP